MTAAQVVLDRERPGVEAVLFRQVPWSGRRWQGPGVWHDRSVIREGWKPSRRNRNIGTTRSGHGRANRLVIPDRWSDDRIFWEKLRDPVMVRRSVGELELMVLIEPVIGGYTHCCTPDDVLTVAGMVPADDLGDLRLFVLRQPTRKQAVLSSVWGRLAYYAQFNARLSGPAIFLEAQELNQPWRQRASMSVDARRELECLRADGHPVEEVGGGYRWQLTLQAARATQLYRTLLHEIGHQVHYLVSVQRPQDAINREDPTSDDRWDRLSERYWAKPTAEKEAFAHRYARELGDRLRREGKFPFNRMADPNRLRDQDLDPAWFNPPEPQA